jgi:hypothetical protein
VIQKNIYKISSTLLAFLVLLSSFSFTIKTHYCGSKLVDVAVFSESKKCGMEAADVCAEFVSKKSCCKDEIQNIEGQEVFAINSFKIVDTQFFIIPNSILKVLSYEDVLTKKALHIEYSPPILIYDIQVLNQVYII